MGLFNIFGRKKEPKKESGWASAPSSIRALPYVVVSGAVSEIIRYYFNVKIDAVVLAGIINIVVLLAHNIFKYISK